MFDRFKEILLPERVKPSFNSTLKGIVIRAVSSYLAEKKETGTFYLFKGKDILIKIGINKDSLYPFMFSFLCEGFTKTLKYLNEKQGYVTLEGPSFRKTEDCREINPVYLLIEHMPKNRIDAITLNSSFYEKEDVRNSLFSEDIRILLNKGHYKIHYNITSQNQSLPLSDECAAKISAVYNEIIITDNLEACYD